MENINYNGKKTDHLESVLDKISSGNAILFLGSGFSASAHGLDGENMPMAEILAQRIGDLQGFDAEKDLRYASSRFLAKGGDRLDLIKMLRETFTVKEVKNHHKAIASAPWRRVYTTNYDLCYEKASEQIGILVDTVDIEDRPSDFQGRNRICVHLNGSLNNLKPDSLDNEFKLTTSSYLSTDSFLNSAWAYPFQRDLEFSSAIVFAGYSMYDIEVQKILHENPEYTSKTFFITKSLKGGKSQFVLEQFGSIVPIGVELFGEKIESRSSDFYSEPDELILASLSEYQVREAESSIRDADVDAFLMRGDISDELIDAAVTGAKGAPLMINREDILYASELIRAKSNIVIAADFGNGKSIFSRALRTRLTLEGIRVFTADHADLRQHDDLESIVRTGAKGCLLIDSYEQNIDLIKHYAELNPADLTLIICARTSVHERYRSLLLGFGLKLNEIVIDDLAEREIGEFIDIIDNIGYWGEKAALPEHAKRSLIKYDHRGQISLNLLSLLSAPHIVERIQKIMGELLSQPEYRDTTFAIALLSANDMPLSSSLISEIALNDRIYSSDLRGNESFRQIFKVEGTRISSKSSIFAISLISHGFTSAYIVDQLLKIVSSIDDGDEELKSIQKSLLRFSVVERLLPEKNRMQSLVRYYENLKREVLWLRRDPHFWLQYGMAQLTYRHYDKAQGYFDQAYSLAEKRYNYHTDHIDTQQARLYLLQSTSVLDSNKSFQLFHDAHKLLLGLPDDFHKYRQVENYKDVFEKSFLGFSKSNKSQFEISCRGMLQSIRKFIEDGVAYRSRSTGRIADMLEGILDKIKNSK